MTFYEIKNALQVLHAAKKGGSDLDILAVILLVVAAALFCLSRILAKRQAEASGRLAKKLEEEALQESEDKDWDAMWDDAHEQIDADVYRLLNHVSGVFRGIAALLAVFALAAIVASRFL